MKYSLTRGSVKNLMIRGFLIEMRSDDASTDWTDAQSEEEGRVNEPKNAGNF